MSAKLAAKLNMIGNELVLTRALKYIYGHIELHKIYKLKVGN